MFGLRMFSKNCNKNYDLYSCEAHRWPLKPEKKTFSLKKKCIEPSAVEAIPIIWLSVLFSRVPYEKKYDTFIPLEPLPQIPM